MTDELRRTWGLNIKALRKGRGWTQKQLAEKVGVCHPTVCRWEKGEISPKDSTKVDLATVLNCDVRMLFPLVKAS